MMNGTIDECSYLTGPSIWYSVRKIFLIFLVVAATVAWVGLPAVENTSQRHASHTLYSQIARKTKYTFAKILRKWLKVCLRETDRWATERHLPYGITRCYIPATRRRWTRPALTPAKQAGTWFIYFGGMEGWVDLGGWLYTEMVYLSADSHQS